MASERVQRRIDRLLDQIEEAIERRDWGQVQELAQDVIALDLDNRDARAFLEAAEQRLSASGPAHLDEGVQSSSNSGSPRPAAQAFEQPSSFAKGRYQVKRFLGEGGKKRVYLAQDTLLDREVAFALIKTEGLDEVSRTRITREAQAMGRLGSHPHIVTVFDLGEHEGQPYMVTELMGGGDVEGVIENAGNHRLPLEQTIDIAKATCRGLEFAHSRGIVHRDLKPGNVWLTGDGTAKIGDFGLAVAIDRSRLTTEGMMVGTVSYMPPEQAMGGEVTPRADLYSLGAMLYEMVTGRPPFLGDDSVAIIGQHINTPPVAPTWHNGECPRPLEALILRLLAKDPSGRPESTADVLAALDGMDLTATSGVGSIEEAQPLDSLAGGVFVGRQREMGELKACLEDALSGRGRLVTLVGEPGIGKTRTAQELATYAGLRSAQVLWGRCYEEQGMPPYWPWMQAIRSYVRERDPEQLRSEMGAGAADIAEVVSDVKERLPDLMPPPQLGSPEQARFRLFDSITAFLKSASLKQPLVLVLDDLHWADQPSLLLLQFVARELGNSRLLLIGTYRDMELSRQHPLAETLGELTRERLFQRVLLRGLSQQDVSRFIEVAAGENPPSGLTEVVHTQTEGNPLFVTEVVRLLAQEGELSSQSGNKDSWTVRIPEGVREVIGRRLNRLSQRCNDTLTIASVIGREFELRPLTPLVEDVSEDRLLEVLEEALAARVIEELPQAVGRYQFTHALIQETLSDELTLTRRVRLHARIAETLEELYGEQVEAHAAELAHHFAEAQTVLGTEKLVKHSLLAGERALSFYAYEEALSHFQRALVAKEGLPIDDETAALLFGQARAQVAMLQFEESLTNLRRGFDYHVQHGNVALAVTVAGYPLPLLASQLAGAPELIADGLSLVPPDSHDAGRLLARYGSMLYFQEADYEGAQQAYERGLVIAQREEDTLLELQILADAAFVDVYNLLPGYALEKVQKAMRLGPDSDHLYSEVVLQYTGAVATVAMGDSDASLEYARSSLVPAEKLRDRTWLGRALSGNLYVTRALGDWSLARSYCDKGLETSPNDIRLLAPRMMLEHDLGDFSQGQVYLARLIDLLDANKPGPTLEYGWTVATLGLVARITGDTSMFSRIRSTADAVIAMRPVTPFVETFARIGKGLIAVIQEDAEAAGEQYPSLGLIRGMMAYLVAGDRILGLLASTMGDLGQAAEHFEDCLYFSRRAGYRPELAWTCCDYADTLLQRNEPGDHEKTMSLLDESLTISSELGMRPLMERVLSRREILKA